MAEKEQETLCVLCGVECEQHHFMCDLVDGAWCPTCFNGTECGKGDHGEGCATMVCGT